MVPDELVRWLMQRMMTSAVRSFSLTLAQFDATEREQALRYARLLLQSKDAAERELGERLTAEISRVERTPYEELERTAQSEDADPSSFVKFLFGAFKAQKSSLVAPETTKGIGQAGAAAGDSPEERRQAGMQGGTSTAQAPTASQRGAQSPGQAAIPSITLGAIVKYLGTVTSDNEFYDKARDLPNVGFWPGRAWDVPAIQVLLLQPEHYEAVLGFMGLTTLRLEPGGTLATKATGRPLFYPGQTHTQVEGATIDMVAYRNRTFYCVRRPPAEAYLAFGKEAWYARVLEHGYYGNETIRVQEETHVDVT